ncbi:polyprotein [Cucumis melo var. makuwa]|uniref:Polyprotein n=1 Tax=Cucumis melo var. makuwa TaxID=1194695 RepID=A0A5A7U4M8_CUCMM|nr:polyprotein [Cucumis melo var. makuwa]
MVTNSGGTDIDWEGISYEDINSTIQKVCLEICQQQKHATKIAKDSNYRREMGFFCKQYGVNNTPPSRKKVVKAEELSSEEEEFSSEKEEDILNVLLEESSDEHSSSENETDNKEAIPCSGCINVLTSTQEGLLDIIEEVDDEAIRKNILLRLREDLETPDQKFKDPMNFSFQAVMNLLSKEHAAPVKVTDLQHEIKVLKKEINENRQQISYLENAVVVIQEQIISKENVETQSADQNVIHEGIISSKYFEITEENLKGAVIQRYFSSIENEIVQSLNLISKKEKQIEFLHDDIKGRKISEEVEKERGVPRLVINYMPLNKVLKWIRLKKNPKPWTVEHSRAVKSIKSLAKGIPCLSLMDEKAKMIVETDASEKGYGEILKQDINGKESLVRFHSGVWNSA